MLKLTPENAVRHFNEDLHRMEVGLPMTFGVGAYVQVLLLEVAALRKRVAALEAAQPGDA